VKISEINRILGFRRVGQTERVRATGISQLKASKKATERARAVRSVDGSGEFTTP